MKHFLIEKLEWTKIIIKWRHKILRSMYSYRHWGTNCESNKNKIILLFVLWMFKQCEIVKAVSREQYFGAILVTTLWIMMANFRLFLCEFVFISCFLWSTYINVDKSLLTEVKLTLMVKCIHSWLHECLL